MYKDDILTNSRQKQLYNMDFLPFKNQLREFLSLSLDRCMKAVEAQSGSIFLFDDSKKELVLEIGHNINNINLEGIRERLGERVAGRVALERKPILVKDIDDKCVLQITPKYSHYRSKSFLSVPLEFAGDLIGVVNITDKSRGETFDDSDLRIVLNISRYLGIALYSLKNYLEKQNRLNEKLNKEIEHLNKTIQHYEKFSSLGKLVGGLVHEINNPLDGIIRYVNLAFDCAEDDTPIKEYLREARNGLVRIAKVVRALLDFSWSLSVREGEVDINRAIKESLLIFNHNILANNIEVKTIFASDLPSLPDYNLRLVFNNIIKNAYEAMKNRGTLTIYTGINNGGIEIKVEDTGEGIPKDLHEKIFEPFFTTKCMGEGSGLGLAISYEIIKRYNGNITLESEPGEGSAFTIWLPVQKHI